MDKPNSTKKMKAYLNENFLFFYKLIANRNQLPAKLNTWQISSLDINMSSIKIKSWKLHRMFYKILFHLNANKVHSHTHRHLCPKCSHLLTGFLASLVYFALINHFGFYALLLTFISDLCTKHSYLLIHVSIIRKEWFEIERKHFEN